MNPASLKTFAFSLLFFLTAASAAGYVLYKQETNGQKIYSSLLYLKAWDTLRQSGQTESQIDEVASKKEKFDSIILGSEGDTVKFLAMLDELSAETGVYITATNLKIQKTKEAGFDELEATFLLRGESEAVEDVIEILELLSYRSHVVGLSLSRNYDGNAEASVSMVVSIRE